MLSGKIGNTDLIDRNNLDAAIVLGVAYRINGVKNKNLGIRTNLGLMDTDIIDNRNLKACINIEILQLTIGCKLPFGKIN